MIADGKLHPHRGETRLLEGARGEKEKGAEGGLVTSQSDRLMDTSSKATVTVVVRKFLGLGTVRHV